ncbi:hypothetical protein NHF46_06870 [Arthrobacter alpinus]|nr:hypothetical protein [Arthrobacter alpinus]
MLITRTTPKAKATISSSVTAKDERPPRGVETTSDNAALDFLTLGSGAHHGAEARSGRGQCCPQ